MYRGRITKLSPNTFGPYSMRIYIFTVTTMWALHHWKVTGTVHHNIWIFSTSKHRYKFYWYRRQTGWMWWRMTELCTPYVAMFLKWSLPVWNGLLLQIKRPVFNISPCNSLNWCKIDSPLHFTLCCVWSCGQSEEFEALQWSDKSS